MNGDLSQIDSIEVEEEIDLFYHLAWEGVSTDFKNDYAIQLRNVEHSLRCFRFAKKNKSKKFIFVSSASEYAYSGKPIDGLTTLPAPCDAYAAVKTSIHIYLELLSKQLEMPYTRIILPSIYGGKRKDANIITYTIRTLLNDKKPSFTKLEQIWEYVYVDDAIDALVIVAENGRNGKSYPIGWGKQEPLAAFIYKIRDEIDPKLELGIGDRPYKTAKVDNCIMDISQTITDTGFFPQS